MELARSFRNCAHLLVLSIAGFAVGCGSGVSQVPLTKEEGKIIREEQKGARQELKEDRAEAKAAAKSERAQMKKGRGRP
jgi:hypothetical protein